ncbi:MAG: A24 family peptidase [Bacillota bacterium]
METISILIRIIISVAVGLMAGLSTIYTFNRIPAKWLCDYHEKPSSEMWGERIKKRPWTVVFALVFTACSLKLLDMGLLYSIPGIIALWLLLQIGIADRKYMIIPDQFIVALAVTALGFIPFHFSYQSQMIGALVGGGSILLMGIIGKLLFRKESIGFGDVKLFAAIGLLCGFKGVVIILLIAIFSSALVFSMGLLTGKIRSGEAQPLGPFIAASTALYILFQPEINTIADLYIGLF